MGDLIIRNGTCLTPFEVLQNAMVHVENGKIKYVGPESEAEKPLNALMLNANGNYICPGFIDLQVNGGNGAETLDASQTAFETIVNFHAKHGATALLLTIVSSDFDKASSALQEIRRFQSERTSGARVLGAHVEGPYISHAQRGAHNPEYLRTAEPDHYGRFLEYLDVIRIVTAAPEIEGVLGLARELTDRGVRMSIGHSDGTFADVRAAVEAGFSVVTHIYCVMSMMRRINAKKIAGILEGALVFDQLSVGVIGDGFHVPEGLIDVVLKAKPLDKVFLTTDAMRAAGLPDGEYLLGPAEDQNKIVVENGAAKTADRKLYAGSTATMDESLYFLVTTGNLRIHEAVQTATVNPARILGVEDERGTLAPGKTADIVIVDDRFHVITTIINGEVVYSSGQLPN